MRMLTTDAEFHSFARQAARLEEDGLAAVERVAAEPFDTFPARFAAAAARRRAPPRLPVATSSSTPATSCPTWRRLVAAVPDADTLVMIDGYHGFMAVPTDLSAIEQRAFYLAGGYKYAMAGEGACFAHCPPGYAERPPDTGWFAGFAELATGSGGKVAYAPGGGRLLGGTLDPTGLYRLNAVQRWLDDLGVTVAAIHAHVRDLQDRFLAAGPHPELLPPLDGATGAEGERGHFLTFRMPDAAAVHAALHTAGVITDYRADRLRIGFGLYHDGADIDELLRRLAGIPGWP